MYFSTGVITLLQDTNWASVLNNMKLKSPTIFKKRAVYYESLSLRRAELLVFEI